MAVKICRVIKEGEVSDGNDMLSQEEIDTLLKGDINYEPIVKTMKMIKY